MTSGLTTMCWPTTEKRQEVQPGCGRGGAIRHHLRGESGEQRAWQRPINAHDEAER